MQSAKMAKRYLLSCPAFAELPHFKRNKKAAAALLDMLDKIHKASEKVKWNLYFAKLCGCILSEDLTKLQEGIETIHKVSVYNPKDKKMRRYQKVFKPLIRLGKSVAENNFAEANSALKILEEQSLLTHDEKALLLVCKDYMATKLLTLLICTCKRFNSKILDDLFYSMGFADLTMANQILPYFNPAIFTEASQNESKEKWINIDVQAAEAFIEQYNPQLLHEETLKEIGAPFFLQRNEDDVLIRSDFNGRYLKRRSSRCLDTFNLHPTVIMPWKKT